MYVLLGHYVEATCNDDLATFNTSGFTAASNTRTAPQPLAQAKFSSIDRGPNSGQAVVYIVDMGSKRKNPSLQESAKEVAKILEDHWASLPAKESKERRRAFSEYVSRAGDGGEKPQRRVQIRASRPSARRGG